MKLKIELDPNFQAELKNVKFEDDSHLEFSSAKVTLKGEVVGVSPLLFRRTWKVDGTYVIFYDPGGGLHISNTKFSSDRNFEVFISTVVEETLQERMTTLIKEYISKNPFPG